MNGGAGARGDLFGKGLLAYLAAGDLAPRSKGSIYCFVCGNGKGVDIVDSELRDASVTGARLVSSGVTVLHEGVVSFGDLAEFREYCLSSSPVALEEDLSHSTTNLSHFFVGSA